MPRGQSKMDFFYLQSDKVKKWPNVEDFRLKEKMIAADPILGSQMPWSFDDIPLNAFGQALIDPSTPNKATIPPREIPPDDIGPFVPESNQFWIPNRVYYAPADWPVKNQAMRGIRVIRFISLFTIGNYDTKGYIQNTNVAYPGFVNPFNSGSPVYDPMIKYFSTIPGDVRNFIKGNDSWNDVVVAGQTGPMNWVGTGFIVGQESHHMRFLRYLAPPAPFYNFIYTDVLNILILFNNQWVPAYPDGGGRTGTWPFGADGGFPLIFDFPRYMAWMGSYFSGDPIQGPGGGAFSSNLFNGSVTEFRFGLEQDLSGNPNRPSEFIPAGTANYTAMASTVDTSAGTGQYFGNGSLHRQYGLSSQNYTDDRARFTNAYKYFKRSQTIVFHNGNSHYGHVPGYDGPRSFVELDGKFLSSSDPSAAGYTVLEPILSFDDLNSFATTYAATYLQSVCADLAPYNFSYGGVIDENTDSTFFLPYIKDYLQQ